MSVAVDTTTQSIQYWDAQQQEQGFAPKQFRRFCDRALYIADGRLEVDATVPEALAAMRAARKEARDGDGAAEGTP